MKNFLNYFVKMIRLERSIITKAVEQAELAIKEVATESKEESIKQDANRDLELIADTKDYLDWMMRLANHFESREIFERIPKRNKGDFYMQNNKTALVLIDLQKNLILD